jgi:hypothetical protein
MIRKITTPSRKKAKQNIYEEVTRDGVICIEFMTGGKYQEKVLVDKEAWDKYLHEYHWTAIKKGNYTSIVTTRDTLAMRLHRIIIENEKVELDYWGNTIDHINNNPLDNRLSNLRIWNSKLNATNIQSKYQVDNNHLIYKQKKGYKVHFNIFDEPKYQNFQTLEDARKWRDTEAIPLIKEKVQEMIVKTRNIEFERGLRDKLVNNEKQEVLEILRRYNVI